MPTQFFSYIMARTS